MDIEHWATLSRLLDEVLDMAPADRESWLGSLTAEYEAFTPRLRAMLERLTASDRPDLFATLPHFELDDDPDGDSEVQAGALVGPYRLIRKLAAGGHGAVWLAERADGLIDRPVALKLPHAGLYRPGLSERIARERAILAALTHPHIARLYDAGLSASGLPFLALEYVEGLSLDTYCERRTLDVRSRVALFLQVVQAVAFAHGQLVVHRDLKPSNVLVTSDGQVRLLDFGIARMLDDGLPGPDSTMTVRVGRAMTVAYASPEQVSYGRLGVTTDVYSLGVMLYELLAGARPYRLPRDTPAALEEAILTVEPLRPSEAAAATARPSLRGDLDAIVLHALRKQPGERYQTAAALADDLQRYLDGRPIVARPDTRWYRARAFVRRNRLAVGAAAAVVAAVAVGATVAVWQAGVARAEQRRANEVKTFIVSLLQDANLDAADTRQASVLDLLRRAETRLSGLPAGPVKAELLVVLGEGLNGLGDTAALEAVATEAVTAAETSGDLRLEYRARILMAWTHMYRGRPESMHAELQRIEPALQRDPNRHGHELATVWRLRSAQAIELGKYQEAVQAAEQALGHIERVAGRDTPPTLTGLMTLTEAYTQADVTDKALSTAERALRVAQQAYPGFDAHPYVISVRAKYASALAGAGDLTRAASEFERVVRQSSDTFGDEGRTVAFHLQRLANLEIKLGRLDAARATITRGLAIIQKHAEPQSGTVAAFRNTAGQVELAAGRGAAALDHLAPVLVTATRAFGASHSNTVNVRAGYALALALSGRAAEADTEIDATIATMAASGPDLVRPLYAAGVISRQLRRPTAAAAYFDRAERAADADATQRWQTLAQQGFLRAELGQTAEARSYLDRAQSLIQETGVEHHAATLEVLAARRRLGP